MPLRDSWALKIVPDLSKELPAVTMSAWVYRLGFLSDRHIVTCNPRHCSSDDCRLLSCASQELQPSVENMQGMVSEIDSAIVSMDKESSMHSPSAARWCVSCACWDTTWKSRTRGASQHQLILASWLSPSILPNPRALIT